MQIPVVLTTCASHELPIRWLYLVVLTSHYRPKAETEVDWRQTSRVDLTHTVHTLPEELSCRCIELTRRLGLRFSAIDFVLDTAGQYWFLEANPNGQWAWIETRTGHPIASAIVSELEHIADEVA